MSAQEKNLSVIIPTYNRYPLLKKTLSSIEKQTVETDSFEVLIVDDGSSDETAEMIRKYNPEFDVKYYFQEDLGYRVASGRNLGIQNAIGNVVLFLDSGMIISKNCFKAHINSHLDSDNKVVIGYMLGLESQTVKIDKNSLIEMIAKLEITEAIEYLIKQKDYLDIRECVFKICNSEIDKLPAPWALFWSGNASVKRDNLLAIGGFDINFDLNWGMEDIDLGYRLFKNDHQFELNRHAAAIHYPHFSDDRKKLREEFENKQYFHKKHKSFESLKMLEADTVSINLQLSGNYKTY